MNIHLHIDRLVLDGIALAPRERARLQAALEQELRRLLAGGLTLPDGAGGSLANLRGQSVRRGRAGDRAADVAVHAPESRPASGAADGAGDGAADGATLGRQLAASLYRGIGGRP